MGAVAIVRSPLGGILLAADGHALTSIELLGTDAPAGRDPAPPVDVLGEAAAQLAAYFSGRLRTFDLPLEPGGTAFDRRVWDAVHSIPFGETATYGAVASLLGRPGAARAVGHANGRNPLPIVIPCHRLVGTGGRLCGYRGGLDAKRSLLLHESR